MKYCMSCGKPGIAAGGTICSFCGEGAARTLAASSPTKPSTKEPTETFTPRAFVNKRGKYQTPDEDEGVQYFNLDELGIDGLDVDTGGSSGSESLGSLDQLNPQACSDYRQAAKAHKTS